MVNKLNDMETTIKEGDNVKLKCGVTGRVSRIDTDGVFGDDYFVRLLSGPYCGELVIYQREDLTKVL